MALGEVAAAFAGFSGVVAALGSRSAGEWSVAARFRFENLLITSIAAALLAFLPIAIGQFPVAPAVTWGCSSAVLGLFCASFAALRIPRLRSASSKDLEPLRRWMALFLVLLFATFVAQIANAAAWPAPRSGGPYVAGILALLLVSALQFTLLALSIQNDKP